MRLRLYGLLSILILSVAAACSNAPPASLATVPPICVAIPALYAQIDTLQALDPTTASRADVDDAVDNLASAWVNLRVQAQALSLQGYEELDQAINRLSLAGAALPPSTTVGEALDELSDEIAAVSDAADAVQDELNCPELTTPSPT